MDAVIREIDGKIVLDDSVGLEVAKAVERHNCRLTRDANAERIAHFARRVSERGDSVLDVVIIIANVDDVHGRILADASMPGFDWQRIRDQGQMPFARGLAGRRGIQDFLNKIDHVAAEKLRNEPGLAVVVVDRGVADVYKA